MVTNMLRKYLITIFLLIGVYYSNAYSQNRKDEIQLTVSGYSDTKEEAIKIALRSAIEQAFGTFVSSNTEMINDEIVKDEIATVSSGNIKSFEVISESIIEGNFSVTLKAIVSINKLIEYTKSKGGATELAGATFAMNMKIRELNKKNELIALQHFINEFVKMSPYVFDYSIELGEPLETKDKNFECNGKVIIKANKNTEEIFEIFHRTLSSLALSDTEQAEYAKNNTSKTQITCWDKENKQTLKRYWLRNSNEEIAKFLQALNICIGYNIFNFQIIDDIGQYAFPIASYRNKALYVYGDAHEGILYFETNQPQRCKQPNGKGIINLGKAAINSLLFNGDLSMLSKKNNEGDELYHINIKLLYTLDETVSYTHLTLPTN